MTETCNYVVDAYVFQLMNDAAGLNELISQDARSFELNHESHNTQPENECRKRQDEILESIEF